MDKFKEFQGKDLDSCIQDACNYYNSPREKLEIEIIQDAKSGIFGIVGARKAKIRARRAQLPEAAQSFLSGSSQTATERSSSHAHRKNSSQRSERAQETGCDVQDKGAERKKAQQSGEAGKKHKPRTEAVRQSGPDNEGLEHGQRREVRKKNWHEQAQAEAAEDNEACDELEDMETWFKVKPLEELDAQRLESAAREIVTRLVEPIAGRKINVAIEPAAGRVRARIDWEGDAGLLIGREGQTLSALQYLASRMLSGAMEAALRVQLDIGDYRRRQDDRLRELAHNLAEKARQTGRSFSTRPLSSYHRRIVHMALQDEADVHTRSSGDGPLKRVVISPKRSLERS